MQRGRMELIMIYFISAVTVICAYLLGSISGAVILSKKMKGGDIRSSGSGNAGATNMLRVYGKKAGALTLLCDALKGVVAVLLGMTANYIIHLRLLKTGVAYNWFEVNVLIGNLHYIAGVFAVIGHIFPVFFGFKGGKGVATSLGVMLMLNPAVGLIVAAASIIIMAVSRYVSLGSITGGVLYPVSVLVYMVALKEVNYVNFVCSLVLGLIVIIKHHANIKRLLSGTENKLFSKK